MYISKGFNYRCIKNFIFDNCEIPKEYIVTIKDLIYDSIITTDGTKYETDLVVISLGLFISNNIVTIPLYMFCNNFKDL